MSDQMNVRLDKKTLSEFEELAKEEHLDRAALVKKILLEGLHRERVNYAIQKYILKEISIERAAQIAKLSMYEFLAVLQELGISNNVSLETLKELV